MENNKLYISNMCQAGFIHKLTSSKPYQHPFIFCCLEEDDFVKFVEQFDKIDFNNYKKLHYNESRIYNRKTQYFWNGWNKRIGIKTEDTPTIEFENGIQLIYPHVHFDLFDEKYKTRLDRFFQIKNKDIYFIMRVRKFMSKDTIDKFYNCNKYKKIILFDLDVPFKNDYYDNEYTKVIMTSFEHYNLVQFLRHNKILENF